MSISGVGSVMLVSGDSCAADRRVVPLRLDAGGSISLWAAKLDSALIGIAEPVIVVAREVAAIAFAHWALLSPARYWRQINGAVLLHPAAPADWKRAGLASTPRCPLPFPSLLVCRESTAASHELSLAEKWRARLITNSTVRRHPPRESTEASLLAVLAFVTKRHQQPAFSNGPDRLHRLATAWDDYGNEAGVTAPMMPGQHP